MNEILIPYSQLLENALRSVVHNALCLVSEKGLPGNHHFYITCNTQEQGLVLPESLINTYPEEITLVLQHQFWDLEVNDESFEVTLSFNGKNERLHVPFTSITNFVDPSVEFGLQFQSDDENNSKFQQKLNKEDNESISEVSTLELDDTVVHLDNFRRP